jgi:hypothetical protein
VPVAIAVPVTPPLARFAHVISPRRNEYLYNSR